MKNQILILVLFYSIVFNAQQKDTVIAFKKRVLETVEVDFLSSYYAQKGVHSSVSGGIGSEQLTDFASNIVIAMPLNDDDVLTLDTGISAYSSASSSNINPFNASGASSGGGYDDDDDDDRSKNGVLAGPTGSPWQASSGASRSDQLVAISANYSHASDSRNFVWNADVAFSNEYDYTSIGFGGGISKLFNGKNSEVSLKVNAYLDQWRPIYPTELSEYGKYGSNFQNAGYFSGVSVYDQNGTTTTNYLPSQFSPWTSVNRNSYSASFGFSQVVTTKMQFSVFFDLLRQEGILSSPYHRIYFADKSNFYIGNANSISNYESPTNSDVYRLADDIERLPNSRIKLPIGARFNYYLNENIVIRTYYRYYTDDWDLKAHTASIELPLKLSDSFTFFPMYRYYIQTQTKYFAPFEKHFSTQQYYTSDFDLSSFVANQYGFGLSYVDIFTAGKLWKFGLKNIDFRFNHYTRSDGLNANIASIAFKFIQQ